MWPDSAECSDPVITRTDSCCSPERRVVPEPEDGGRGEAAHVGAGELQHQVRAGGDPEAAGGHGGAIDPDQGGARGI